uniref:Uncharacterized protein n=1 Tax=Tanacetum cinerariifolium TaxID=118510 RepID=A0A699IG20_TANCI|nr:hypothetical protein [Tanacetum cinerariifolium]GEZ35043.1 hypothetical protein [Tanacetum cinerariifolium]GEZ57156.1 hypothetical protein [Tanacetum cinerariifolium]
MTRYGSQKREAWSCRHATPHAIYNLDPMSWLELSSKTPLDGTSLTPKLNANLLRDRNLTCTVTDSKVGEDVAMVREYRGAVETVRFMEGLQQDDLERHDRSLLLMREMEVKAREKSKFILRLSGYDVD